MKYKSNKLFLPIFSSRMKMEEFIIMWTYFSKREECWIVFHKTYEKKGGKIKKKSMLSGKKLSKYMIKWDFSKLSLPFWYFSLMFCISENSRNLPLFTIRKEGKKLLNWVLFHCVLRKWNSKWIKYRDMVEVAESDSVATVQEKKHWKNKI